jgi:hypothetical protein
MRPALADVGDDARDLLYGTVRRVEARRICGKSLCRKRIFADSAPRCISLCEICGLMIILVGVAGLAYLVVRTSGAMPLPRGPDKRDTTRRRATQAALSDCCIAMVSPNRVKCCLLWAPSSISNPGPLTPQRLPFVGTSGDLQSRSAYPSILGMRQIHWRNSGGRLGPPHALACSSERVGGGE